MGVQERWHGSALQHGWVGPNLCQGIIDELFVKAFCGVLGTDRKNSSLKFITPSARLYH